MILGSLVLKREGLLYMALCGGLFFIKWDTGASADDPVSRKKIIPLVMPIAHAEGI